MEHIARGAIATAFAVTALSVAHPASAQSAEPVDLLPMLEVERGAPRDAGQSGSPVGGYVRFFIERDETEPLGAPRQYSREHRSWLSRYLVGRTFSRNLRVQVRINRADAVTSTITLASASFQSNRREGENWLTELNDRQFLTQFVRIDTGTTAAVEVTLAAATQVTADVTRNLLNIVEAGARLVAPGGPLVTPAVAERLNQASTFVDNSISALFSESVEERAQTGFAAENWNERDALARIRADFPIVRPIRDETNARRIGAWRVVASDPIVSIFSNVPLHAGSASSSICPTANGAALPERDRQACLAFVGLLPSTVMQLPVGEDQTLGQALRGDAGISAAQQRFASDSDVGTQDRRAAATAREMCSLLSERATALGLNAYDTAAAVWAFAWEGNLDSKLAQRLLGSECPAAALGGRLGLSQLPISAAPTETAESHQAAGTTQSGTTSSEPATEPPPTGE